MVEGKGIGTEALHDHAKATAAASVKARETVHISAAFIPSA
jgi:hypothetical protein